MDLVLVGLAGLAAGIVNALAGGGSLVTFPALVAIGVPPIAASVTNTVALVPGYFGATWAQLRDLRGQRRRVLVVLPVSALGGLIGGLLLLNSGARLFAVLVPFLILLAAALLAAGEPIKTWLARRRRHGEPWAWGAPLLLLAAVYGGYFGAGLSVMVLAILGVIVDEPLGRVNALKQVVSFVINLTAALLFLLVGKVAWGPAAAVALGALLGGYVGGRLAGKVKPAVLRWSVVVLATAIAVTYLARL